MSLNLFFETHVDGVQLNSPFVTQLNLPKIFEFSGYRNIWNEYLSFWRLTFSQN